MADICLGNDKGEREREGIILFVAHHKIKSATLGENRICHQGHILLE
jgi:hypothetical protein